MGRRLVCNREPTAAVAGEEKQRGQKDLAPTRQPTTILVDTFSLSTRQGFLLLAAHLQPPSSSPAGILTTATHRRNNRKG